MELVEPDYHTLLILVHRRWIETRDANDGDRFAALVAELTRRPPPERKSER